MASIKLVSETRAPSVAAPTKDYAGIERRLIVRLESYWLSLRRCASGPFFEDFFPARNPVPWENCFIAYFGAVDAEPVFDHLGSLILVLFKPDRTNLPDQEWLTSSIAAQLGNMGEALSSGKPVRREGRLNLPGGKSALFRSILLPFADLERKPSYVLGAVTCRFDPVTAV
ncbi:MAG TPA: hypothetical protein VK433_10360 [Stellaceae bacterium]|nr:hypothetical protein [Stellaceae bacterium]